MPVIPKLTFAIKQTEHSLLDRIGVISLMHEGRGVQAVEKLITQLQQIGDNKSVEVVRVIQRDEFKHFDLGWKWFFRICELQSKEPSVEISHINAAYKAKIQLPKHKSTSYS